MEDEADMVAKEKKFAEWTGAAGGSSDASAGAGFVEDVVEESAKEKSEVEDPPALERKRVRWRASSGELVRPGRTMQRQQAQAQP